MNGTDKNKETKADRTKARLRDCALALFREKGFDSTSVQEITQAAGLTKSAFYVHFKSKYSLFSAFIDSLDIDYSAHQASLNEETAPLAAFFRFTEIVLDMLENRLGKDVLRALYRAQVAGDISTEHYISKDRDLFRIYRELLERAKREGIVRADLDCGVFTDHLVMAIRGMVFEWCARSPGFSLRKEVDLHLRLLVDGILCTRPAVRIERTDDGQPGRRYSAGPSS